jgi:hypothetical protein
VCSRPVPIELDAAENPAKACALKRRETIHMHAACGNSWSMIKTSPTWRCCPSATLGRTFTKAALLEAVAGATIERFASSILPGCSTRALLPTTVEQISQVGACQTYVQQRTATSATCDGLLQASTTFAFVTGDCTHTHLTCMAYTGDNQPEMPAVQYVCVLPACNVSGTSVLASCRSTSL